MIKRWPGSNTIDNKLLEEVEDELVPKSERGKFKMGSFLDISCLPENDCQGSDARWENVSIYTNAGKDGARYDVINWLRDECKK
jgi:hypothetical protein